MAGRAGAVAGGVEGGGVMKGEKREREVRREGDVERDEREAAREWLRHVEAGRLG